MRIKKIQEGVWESSGEVATIDRQDIEFLKEQLPSTPLNRARICIHRSPDAPIHEMIIALGRNSYIRPHKHLGKPESFHLIEGRADAIFFDDAGEITDVIELAANGSTFYHTTEGRYHMQIVRSSALVFHEVTSGPFRREETVFADWSPSDESPDEVTKFLAAVESKLKAHTLAKTP